MNDDAQEHCRNARAGGGQHRRVRRTPPDQHGLDGRRTGQGNRRGERGPRPRRGPRAGPGRRTRWRTGVQEQGRGPPGAARSTSRRSGTEPMPSQEAAAQPAPTEAVDVPREPEVVPKPVPEIDELPEPIVIEADDTPGEAFHTEPKAASRDSEHGGSAGRPRGGRGVRRGDPQRDHRRPRARTPSSGPRRPTPRRRPLSRSPRSRPRRHRTRSIRTGRSERAARPRTLDAP